MNAGRYVRTARIHARGRVERTLPFWPATAIEALQRRRVRSIVRHAYETVPFYRDAMDERSLRPDDFNSAEDLARLPLVDRLTVQQELDRFLSSSYADEGSRTASYTSGSTSGIRRTIYWDHGARARLLARNERVRPILLRLAGDGRGALLLRDAVGEQRAAALQRRAGRPLDPILTAIPSTGTIRTFTSSWAERTAWRSPGHYELSPLLPFEAIVERLNEVRPRLVLSFGSFADLFFRSLEESGVDVHLPRAWDYVADGISAGIKDLAAERGCALHSSYQTVEAGLVGFECERCDGHHLNIDLCALRLVGEDGEHVPPGTPGTVVISNLFNRAMVLLNYRFDDVAVLARDPCPCGRSLPLLAELHGRSSDLLTLADGRKLSALQVEGLFRGELRPALKVQIAQSRPGEIRWRIVRFRNADPDALRRTVLERADEVFGDAADVTVEFVDDIASSPTGKFSKVASD